MLALPKNNSSHRSKCRIRVSILTVFWLGLLMTFVWGGGLQVFGPHNHAEKVSVLHIHYNKECSRCTKLDELDGSSKAI